MPIDTLLADAAAHAGAGIALSILDYVSAKLANPGTRRVEEKARRLTAMEKVMDAQGDDPSAETERNSAAYAQNIAEAREGLRRSGMVKLHRSFGESVKDGFHALLFGEKVNSLSVTGKLGLSAVIEILYDLFWEFSKREMGGIAATLYQIPAFFVGLWLGKLLTRAADAMLISEEEARLDETLEGLVQKTSLAEIVTAYVPSEAVKTEMAASGTKWSAAGLTRAGKKIAEGLESAAADVKDAAGDALAFKEKREEAEKAVQTGRRDRFDDITKGR